MLAEEELGEQRSKANFCSMVDSPQNLLTAEEKEQTKRRVAALLGFVALCQSPHLLEPYTQVGDNIPYPPASGRAVHKEKRMEEAGGMKSPKGGHGSYYPISSLAE